MVLPGPARIDDETPTPEHARLSWPRLARVALVGMALRAVVLGAIAFQTTWHGTLTRMACFFTKAALRTFGGAYAPLPYVYFKAQWSTTDG
jgi:chromate transporter